MKKLCKESQNQENQVKRGNVDDVLVEVDTGGQG